MKYSAKEVIQYVAEEDVKFIRLAFCDVYGKQKNISIMPGELPRAFRHGVAIDASAIRGFGEENHSDLFLHPDPSTISVLPWRPEHGRVVRMFCDVRLPDGTPFDADARSLLRGTCEKAKEKGFTFFFGSELEFYLFKCAEDGTPTAIPYDDAGYMDIAPADKGENVRREICLTLEQMGILPESSHHEEGPGQNEIDFHYAEPLIGADQVITVRSAVRTIAARNGLFADFSPKPLADRAGSGMHINFSVKSQRDEDVLPFAIAGILRYAPDMTVFLNPTENSFLRLGADKAPDRISWSPENRSTLIRVPAASGEYRRAELRSPDATANPYLAYVLMTEAALYGIEEKLPLPAPSQINFYTASDAEKEQYVRLPKTLAEAKKAAAESEFIRRVLPARLIDSYCR